MAINPLVNLSVQQLKRAVTIREEIDSLERELDRITGGQITSAGNAAPGRRRGRLSPAAKARISAAMKARWAKVKGQRRRLSKSSMEVKTPKSAATRARRPSAPGQLKERIVQILKAAGKSGVKVKDVATKLGTSYGNISVWFHTTAKKVKEIKKVGPGRFAWVS